MPFYKFGPNDIFHSQIKAHPEVDFFIYDRKVFYNHQSNNTIIKNNVRGVSASHLSLYELNIDRSSSYRSNLIYPFVNKSSELVAFKTVTTSSFSSDSEFGDEIKGKYPLSSSISVDFHNNLKSKFTGSIDSLRTSLDYWKRISPRYDYEKYWSGSSNLDSNNPIKIISIPSIFYGSSIRKGSVSLKYYISGTLAGELRDDKENGELRQALPVTNFSGGVAGVVLYNEGFILISSSLQDGVDFGPHVENYDPFATANRTFRWTDFATTGTTGIAASNVPSSSFEMKFEGTNYIPVKTMFCHAPKGELNHSNNPTYAKFGSATSSFSGTFYKEEKNTQIKNIVKSNFSGSTGTGSFAKTTYISKIGVYDKDRNLIGVAKLAIPIRKREQDEFTFKLKMDF